MKTQLKYEFILINPLSFLPFVNEMAVLQEDLEPSSSHYYGDVSIKNVLTPRSEVNRIKPSSRVWIATQPYSIRNRIGLPDLPLPSIKGFFNDPFFFLCIKEERMRVVWIMMWIPGRYSVRDTTPIPVFFFYKCE